MTDERRKLIAEAMGAREGWHLRDAQDAAYDAIPAAVELIEELTVNGSESNRRISVLMVEGAELLDRTEKAEATIATQAKEIERLREDGDATRERSNGWAVAATEAARCADGRDATVAKQAKEIERLRSFVERCAEGEHPDEIPEEAQDMLK